MIRLSWPSPTLNPNKRVHWRKLASYKRTYKAIWFTEMHNQDLRGKREFRINFAPPDKRRRDLDNIIASLKSCQDALSDAAMVDDSQFKMHWPVEFLPPEKGGAVYVEVLG